MKEKISRIINSANNLSGREKIISETYFSTSINDKQREKWEKIKNNKNPQKNKKIKHGTQPLKNMELE